MNRLVLLLVILMGIHACSEKSEQANENRKFSALVINEMRGIAIDKEGYLYIPDNKAAILYKVSPDGVVTGLRTYPVKRPFDVAVDNNNRIVVCDATNSEVFVLNEFDDAKSVVDNTERLLFHGATTVGFDAAGNLYVGENDVNVVRKITPEGEVSILAGAFKQSGNSEDGIGSDARIRRPRSITVLPSGLIYLADEYTHLIRKITPEGVVTTIAGAYRETGADDGQGAEARFDRPRGITADSKGNVFVMDTNNNTIRKITPDGMVSTFAGVAGEAGYLDGVGSAARFNGPRAAAIDANDNIFVTDEENYAVRMISPEGRVTTVIAPQIPPVASAD